MPKCDFNKDAKHWCSHVNLLHIFRTPLGGCFWKMHLQILRVINWSFFTWIFSRYCPIPHQECGNPNWLQLRQVFVVSTYPWREKSFPQLFLWSGNLKQSRIAYIISGFEFSCYLTKIGATVSREKMIIFFSNNVKFEKTKSQIKAHLSYLAISYFYNYKPSPRILRQHRDLRNLRKNKEIIINTR